MTLVFLLLGLIVLIGVYYWLFMSSYSQLFGAYPYKKIVDNKVIALTFDDGPNGSHTSQIVDYLDSKNIKATFFQVGKCIERYPELTKRIYNNGHVIGNHSLSHSFHKYFESSYFKNEIASNQAIIEKYIGIKPALFRLPWLFRQPWLLRTIKQHKLQVVSGVFCSSIEVLQPSAASIAKATIKKAKPGTIIIFHDGVESKSGNRSQTVGAVKIVVEELLNRGFSFVTVDKLLEVPAYQGT